MRAPACLGLAALVLAGPAAPAQERSFSLPSGLACVLIEQHDQPMIRLELTTRWDLAEEPPRLKGLGGFLASMLKLGGAGPLGQAEFARALDDLGLEYGFEARRDGLRWTLAMDSRVQEPALELLANAVYRPTFDQGLMEQERQALVQRIAASSHADQARDRFLWTLGDAGTVLPPALGGLLSLTYEDLQAFRRRVVRPERSTLVLHGDLSLAQAKELVLLHFGLWGGEPGKRLEGSSLEPPPAPRLLAQLGGGADVELWAGSESASCPAEVKELLGLLLEQAPAVASPGVIRTCSLGEGQPLLVKLKASGSGQEALVEALQATLERLRQGFTEAELDRARARWKARLAALPLHPRDLLRRVQEGALKPEFRQRVEAVRARDVNAALGLLLAPERLRFLMLDGNDRLVQTAEQAGLGPVELAKPYVAPAPGARAR